MTDKCSEPSITKLQVVDGKSILKRKKLIDQLKSSLIKSQMDNGKDSEEIEFLLRRL
jgi:hypothetical protein